ncbi:MAG: diguanylate cyclase, partial [Thermodesulfovibrionia bacterium]|nr:diguanylate cyclase [Thermodesulfovibrionia bacterium]
MVCAENTRKLIESHPFKHREKQPLGFVSVSGGVAAFPLHGNTIKELIEHADEALYESKKSGKNRITEYKQSAPSIDNELKSKSGLSNNSFEEGLSYTGQ